MQRQFKVCGFGSGAVVLVAMLSWSLRARAAEGGFPPLLYAAEGAGKIIEYGRDGKVAWEYPAPICGQQSMVEVDAADSIV